MAALPSSAYEPHAPILASWMPGKCAICTLSLGNPVHVMTLPGMELADSDRAKERAIALRQARAVKASRTGRGNFSASYADFA